MIKPVTAVVLMLALIIPSQGGLARFSYAPARSHNHLVQSNESADIVHADIKLADPDLQAKPDAESSKPLSFDTINGIDINWNKDQLVQGAGYPDGMRKDEMLGTVELLYPSITVGIYHGQIDYLIVLAGKPSITIGGSTIPLSFTSLRLKLGQPDFVAEDGIVYERDGICLKLFYKPGTAQKKLDSVQIFWSAEV